MIRFLPLGLVVLLVACGRDDTFVKQSPTLDIQPDVLDLGDVNAGSTAQGELTLADVGNAQITITSVVVTNDEGDYFDYTGEMPVVPRLESTTLLVDYTPTEPGYHSATVTITYDNPDEPTVSAIIRAHAVVGSARVYPGLLDFGNVAIGDSRTKEVTIANDGALDLELTEASFTSPDFTLNEVVPYALPAGSETAIEISFTASSDAAVDEEVVLDLGGLVTLPAVQLRANDCAQGDPAVYDEDTDGYTTCGGDCDDQDGTVHPGGTETEDASDEDCDGIVDEGTNAYDDDGDGLSENGGDCNDGDADVSPAAIENYTNGIDDDCDGTVDNGTPDADSDGYAESGGDCEDHDATVYPDAPELPDGIDNDCDSTIDEGTTNYDDDGDGFAEIDGDCDDTDRTIYPRASESADWQDNDCDGTVDEGTDNYDDDGDGFTETGGDCNDGNAAVSPAAAEVSRNGIDDNCDGTTS